MATTEKTNDTAALEKAREEALDILQKAKDEAAAMLAQAQEATAALLKAQEENAEKAKDEAAAAKLPAAVQAMVDADEELVEVEMFYDGSKYKDDVFVAVNGESCQIRRGDTVKIKRKFARVIEQGRFQDAAAQRLREKLAADFARASKEHGIG